MISVSCVLSAVDVTFVDDGFGNVTAGKSIKYLVIAVKCVRLFDEEVDSVRLGVAVLAN